MAIPDKANLTSEELVRSWGLEPRAAPAEAPFVTEPSSLGRAAGYYLGIGAGLGGLIGFATFVGAYIYCIATYGFIFGFGLGWIPSGIVALIVSQVVRFLWGPIILLVALAVVFVARMSVH
jgi:hypothetical protein